MKQASTVLLLCALAALAACAPAPERAPEQLTLAAEEAYRCADGTAVSLWRSDARQDAYRLPDGTELLRVSQPTGPENVRAEGLDSFQDLAPAAQEAVRAYYDGQGLLYDVERLAADAYGDYTLCQTDGGRFLTHFAQQSVSPILANERVMAFLTTVTQPASLRYDQTVTESMTCAVFDRETGVPLPAWALFTLDEAQARKHLVSLCAASDGRVESAELEQGLDAARLLWFSDSLELAYPPGSFAYFDNAYLFSFTYEELSDVLQPWMLPLSPAD